MPEKSLAVFEGKQIRRHYDKETETWYFSVVDIMQVLIQQPDYQAARNYWKVLKNRLNKEGSESVTKCNRLKMEWEERRLHCQEGEARTGGQDRQEGGDERQLSAAGRHKGVNPS